MSVVLPQPRRWRCLGTAFTLLCLSLASLGPARAAEPPAELPMAPSPEAVTPVGVVVPASAPVDRSAPLPLGPLPLGADADSRGGAGRAAHRPLPDWKLLAAVGAAFAALVAFRFCTGRTRATLPPDVFEVLGEASLGGQHAVRIVRFGPRTLLVGISSAGCQTLAELSDPQSTECIVSACRGSRGRGPEASRTGASRPRHAGASSPASAAARAAGGIA
jgi:hypothetical protein